MSVGDIEKNYRSTLSKTPLRSDRGDLGLYSFAGSNLHGGKPAADKGSMPKPTRSTNQDLYAPLKAAEYGKGYYDHLRATSPERRVPRSRPNVDLYAPLVDTAPRRLGVDTEYKTLPSKVSTEFDYSSDLPKTTTKKTTITEQWVPLTTYIYNTPHHSYYYRSTPHSSYTYRTADDLYSYNYVDDYKRTTTRTKNIDALDLSVTSKTKTDYSHYVDKCQSMQSQLNEVSKSVYEAETKLQNEVVAVRNRIQADLTEVGLVVDDTARYNEDLYRAIKKQSKQISALNSKYDEVNRHIADVSDTLEKTRLKCQSLQSDLTSMQTTLDLSMKRIY